MFVRVKTTPNSPRKSVQLVESVRVGKAVRQRIVRHIGIALDEEELVKLNDLAAVVKAKLEADTQPQLFPPEDVAEQLIAARSRRDDAPLKVDLKQLIETQRLTSGIHAVYGAVYEALGLSRLLPAWRYRASHKALFHNVMARLANPDSKRASVRALAADFGVQVSPAPGVPHDGPARCGPHRAPERPGRPGGQGAAGRHVARAVLRLHHPVL